MGFIIFHVSWESLSPILEEKKKKKPRVSESLPEIDLSVSLGESAGREEAVAQRKPQREYPTF